MKYRLECRSGAVGWYVIGQVSSRKDADYWLEKYRTMFRRRVFRAVVVPEVEEARNVRMR